MKKIISIEIKYMKDPSEKINDLLKSSVLGYYAGKSDNYYRNGEYDIYNSIDDKKYDKDHFVNNVSTLYRLPNLTLSRDKLANFKEECGFNVIRDKNKADIVVIGENTLKKMTEVSYRDCYEYVNFRNSIINKHTSLNQEDKSVVVDFLNSIADEHGEDVYITNYCPHYWYSSDEPPGRKLDVNSFLQSSFIETKRNPIKPITDRYVHYVKPDCYDLYNWIYNNQTNLIKDTVLNKLCVEDSVALTVSEFEQLDNLVSSRDEENVNIGLTMMANCNVEESKVYIALLFAKHSDNMKGRKVWNHVNFKYLRKIFDKYINMQLSSWGQAYTNLIKNLVNDKCLNKWSSRYIVNLMFERVINSHLGIGNDRCAFTLTANDIGIIDKYAEECVDYVEEVESCHNYDLPF